MTRTPCLGMGPFVQYPGPWRFALFGAIAFLAAASLIMAALQIALIIAGSDAVDWHTFAAAVDRFGDGTLYSSAEWWYHFRWSPIAVVALAPVVWMGETMWRALHLLALVGLPGWSRWLALASYPLWFDINAGNVLIFVTVAAFWALRGNRVGITATLIMTLLAPRPMMLPLAAWILLKHAGWRVPFAVLFMLHAAAVAATGYGAEWAAVLVGSISEIDLYINVAPSALLGLLWMIVAVPIAACAFKRGHPATAGLMLQPYWFPYYLLVPLADRWTLDRRQR